MDLAVTKFPERSKVLLCPVPFVFRKTVVRELLIELPHEAITGHLRDYGCGSKRKALRVAIDDRCVRDAIVVVSRSIDKKMVR